MLAGGGRPARTCAASGQPGLRAGRAAPPRRRRRTARCRRGSSARRSASQTSTRLLAPITTQSLLSPAYSRSWAGHGDPALAVRHLVRGAGEEHPAVVADAALGDRRGAQQVGDPAELGHREDEQAAFLTLGDHQSPLQIAAELRGQCQPALVVQARGVRAEKHRAPPQLAVTATSQLPHCDPPYPTLHHRQSQNAGRSARVRGRTGPQQIRAAAAGGAPMGDRSRASGSRAVVVTAGCAPGTDRLATTLRPLRRRVGTADDEGSTYRQLSITLVVAGRGAAPAPHRATTDDRTDSTSVTHAAAQAAELAGGPCRTNGHGPHRRRRRAGDAAGIPIDRGRPGRPAHHRQHREGDRRQVRGDPARRHRPAGRGSPAHRGRARASARPPSPRRWPGPSTARCAGCSSPRTCCPATSPA